MASTLITAGDASNGLVTTGGNDNTLTIQTGAAGAKVNAIALASDGTATFLKNPVSSTAQSMVSVNTGNGYGSSSTKIRRFTNIAVNQGSDITYADSATAGASFTINTSGVYGVSYSDNFNAVDVLAITNNATSGATSVRSVPIAEVYAHAATASANYECCVGTTRYFASGTVIVPRTHAASPSGTSTAAVFTITRVA